MNNKRMLILSIKTIISKLLTDPENIIIVRLEDMDWGLGLSKKGAVMLYVNIENKVSGMNLSIHQNKFIIELLYHLIIQAYKK